MAAYGTTGEFNEDTQEVEIVDILYFPAECVMPPDGVGTIEWIENGLEVPEGVDCTGMTEEAVISMMGDMDSE